MLIKKSGEIKESEITPESVYNSRRNFLRAGAVGAMGALAGGLWARDSFGRPVMTQEELAGIVKSPLSTDEDQAAFPRGVLRWTNIGNFEGKEFDLKVTVPSEPSLYSYSLNMQYVSPQTSTGTQSAYPHMLVMALRVSNFSPSPEIIFLTRQLPSLPE